MPGNGAGRRALRPSGQRRPRCRSAEESGRHVLLSPGNEQPGRLQVLARGRPRHGDVLMLRMRPCLGLAPGR